MKLFINSQFGYCPVAGINKSEELKHWINRILERALMVVYYEEYTTFTELLNSVKIWHKFASSYYRYG